MDDMDFKELKEIARDHPEEYWMKLAMDDDIYWHQSFTSVLENKTSYKAKWFVNGKINMCYNCLDKPISEGHGDKVVMVYESVYTKEKKEYTYNEIYYEVCRLGNVLRNKCNLKLGDRIVIYLPMVPECLFTMLACCRLGITYCIIFGGFPTKEISFRIGHTESKLVVTSNIGYSKEGELQNYKESVDKAIAMLPDNARVKVEHCLVFNRPNTKPANMVPGRDFDFYTELKLSDCFIDPVPLPSDHPIFIIYTSGTSGIPKGLVIPTAGHIIMCLTLPKYGYDLGPGSSWFTNSDFGWILGQTAMTYATLLGRCRTIIMEGGLISNLGDNELLRLIDTYKINWIFVTPTTMRLMRNSFGTTKPKQSYPSLKYIVIGGEICELNLRTWISDTFGIHPINMWGQTEFGGTASLPFFGIPGGREAFPFDDSIPMIPGINPVILTNEMKFVTTPNVVGKFLLKLPLTPNTALTMLKNDDLFKKLYFEEFEGYYDTKDIAFITTSGTVKIISRSDDIIQVGATRVSSVGLENICKDIEEVSDATIVPLDDPIYGQVPFGFIVPTVNIEISNTELIDKIISSVADCYGDIAKFNKIVLVPDLPKSKNGKSLPKSLCQMINCKVYNMPPVIENENIYSVIAEELNKIGIKSTLPQ